MTQIILELLGNYVQMFDEIEINFEFNLEGLVLIDESVDINPLNPLKLDFKVLTLEELNTLCRVFIQDTYLTWIVQDNLDIYSVEQLRINKASFFKL